MNTLNKKLALVVAGAAVCISMPTSAKEAVLKVKTVEQVKVTQKTPIDLGTIPATAGYKCGVPQRIEARAPGTPVTDGTTSNTFTVEDVTLFPGITRCGGSATPGVFWLNGVGGQSVTISFGTVADENSVGTFRAEGIFEAAQNTDLSKSPYTTVVGASVPALQAAADALLTAQYTQIFSQKTVTLSPNGLGMLRVGGTLEVDSELDPDQTYSVNYVVNVVYN